MTNRRILWAALLGASAMASQAIAADDLKLPFSISKETTVITAPLLPDGSPDYLAAINDRYGKGVTPENNAFLVYLQVMGTGERVLDPATKTELLKRVGGKEVPDAQAVWEDYANFLKRSGVTGDDLTRANTEISLDDSKTMLGWMAADRPHLAEYLKASEKQLALIAQASRREKFWVPLVATPGRILRSFSVPAAARFRDAATLLAVRARMRITAGDFDGFLDDVTTAIRFARQVQGGIPTELRNPGTAMESAMDDTIATVAAGGSLTEAQCRRLRAALQALPPRLPVTERTDVMERWGLLEMVRLTAVSDPITMHAADVPQRMTEAQADARNISGFVDLERRDVDWNIVMKMANAHYDAQMKLEALPSQEAFDKANEAFTASWTPPRPPGGRGFERKQSSDESREAFSDRIGRQILLSWTSTRRADRPRVTEDAMHDQMLETVLAAATSKAARGKWPATLQDLVPDYLKQVPKDIYSPNASDDVTYVQSAEGILIYSPARTRQMRGSTIQLQDGTQRTQTLTVQRPEIALGVKSLPRAAPGSNPAEALP